METGVTGSYTKNEIL